MDGACTLTLNEAIDIVMSIAIQNKIDERMAACEPDLRPILEDQEEAIRMTQRFLDAATGLLEACQAAKGRLAMLLVDEPFGKARDRMVDTDDMLRRAIAKATGT